MCLPHGGRLVLGEDGLLGERVTVGGGNVAKLFDYPPSGTEVEVHR
jgi:hypothetical protein